MKLKFTKQEYQMSAVKSTVDLFKGQEKLKGTFSVVKESQMRLDESDLGIKNCLTISKERLLHNLNEVQKRNNLPQTDELDTMQFSIEMETGTGKTYVFVRTIYELNRLYGFTKFIIVVPSIPIREGDYKFLEITKEHFANDYDRVPIRYFIYNSAKLSDVRQFAVSSNIEVMIINIDAFKKAENIINQAQDKLNGDSAMTFIKDTNPILIIDEPQSVDHTEKAKEALASLNPLCTFRYSATFRDTTNLIYRLTPVDAFEMGLVKQISVVSSQAGADAGGAYIRLISVNNKDGFKAKMEIDKLNSDKKVERKTITVKPGSDLYKLSGNRDIYDGYVVAGIDCTNGFECVEFDNTQVIKLGQTIGGIDELLIKKEQIRRTVETHLQKELMYYEKGIKVLSLFFIDKVANYRGEEGEKGVFAKLFEEAYEDLLNQSRFAVLEEKFPFPVEKVHGGYFSQDKKGRLKNTKGDTNDDVDTYNTIMKDKEWLLSFECPLRFIFSHSALKEGWDNPNVFQVCTLIEQKSLFTCRQKIGRGMRLCVNQQGDRITDRDINVLHVMANESFAEFADKLQKEYEEDTGVRFGILNISLFNGITYTETIKEEKSVDEETTQMIIAFCNETGLADNNGIVAKNILEAVEKEETAEEIKELKPVFEQMAESEKPVSIHDITGMCYTIEKKEEKTFTYDDAKKVLEHFEEKGYVSKGGKIKDTMKEALKNGTLDLPKRFEAAREKLMLAIQKADKKVIVRDASKDVFVKLKKEVLLTPEFLELWDKIKYKTVYRTQIDEEALKQGCIKRMKEMSHIPKAHIVTAAADIHVDISGVGYKEKNIKTTQLESKKVYLPNILHILREECGVPKRLCRDILIESGRGMEVYNNPQLFIENVIEIINNVTHSLVIDGIKYHKSANEEYYVQEIFDSEELMANLDKNAVEVEHSVYDYVIYDSETVEKPMAVALDNDPEVKMFFKIPSKFKIETPLGSYNPDWAILLEKDGEQKLYFVLETKGSTNLLDLRTKEQLKIHCGQEHFKALGEGIALQKAENWKDFKIKAI
ncbi:MAG: DEAD/DEAH box helicase family protein [Firmicutes bacterium]|nr:DEAD/DEAH box helicase family protein [Bacillota bacterium]